MLGRRTILPKTFGDWGATGLFVCAIPLVFWFEMAYVLPYFYSNDSFWYYWHMSMACAILSNILSSYIYVVMIDTSVRGRFIASTDDTHICAECECVVPARSWHCSACKICVLKRDHHCSFCGCCIGYFNHRYFFLLVFYVFVGSAYATYFNVIFIYQTWTGFDIHYLMSIVLPLVTIMLGNMSFHLNMIVLFLSVGGMIFTAILFYYHATLVLNGTVNFEMIHKIDKYNLGWRSNLKQVFGERWYIAWISPMISSKLPGDGIQFPSSDFAKTKHI